MTDFERVAQGTVRVRVGDHLVVLQFAVVLPGHPGRFFGAPGQLVQERAEQVRVVGHGGWELPEHRAEFGAEGEQAAGEEGRERGVDVLEALHVGDEAGSLHCEDEVVRGLSGPLAVAGRAL